jgi:hypothetical protein
MLVAVASLVSALSADNLRAPLLSFLPRWISRREPCPCLLSSLILPARPYAAAEHELYPTSRARYYLTFINLVRTLIGLYLVLPGSTLLCPR